MATKAQTSKVQAYVGIAAAHARLLKRLEKLQMQAITSAETVLNAAEALKAAGITGGFETTTHVVNIQSKKVRRVIPAKLKAFKADDTNFKLVTKTSLTVSKL